MLFYDFEVFKYDWLVVILDTLNREKIVIVNDVEKLNLVYKNHINDIWVGYNSRHYDQWILKGLLCGFDAKEINDFIILKGKKGFEYSTLLRDITINNFDVAMPLDGGLKSLEGFLGNDIQESGVSFTIDRKLTQEEIKETIKYCTHDVEQTMVVFLKRQEEFESQMSLLKTFDLPLAYIGKTKAQLTACILGARQSIDRNDEFDIQFPDTLRVEKYKQVLNWYKNPLNHDYDKYLEIDIAGVPHKFAWGGIHGARKQYHATGYFINVDVASYYPALMIEYDYLSRNVSDKNKYRKIRDDRLVFKKEKNPKQYPYKIVLNGTFGAMKDKYNGLYDPRQANNVCVGGQLLLLDLIERLEGVAEIIQSNTDGVLVKMPDGKNPDTWFDSIDDICFEWEKRTRMSLEFDEFVAVHQKDVNNYVIVDSKGGYKSKGAYVKKLGQLDYDLPIVNTALMEYILKGIHPRETIYKCDDLRQFQKILKVSSKYSHAVKDMTIETIKSKKYFSGGEILDGKCFRVFASAREKDGAIYKVKEGSNPAKFANSPEKCFIDNGDIWGKKCPDYLDKEWYVKLTIERLKDFGIKGVKERI